jgi:MFS transporter, SHS family, lactate transporter
VKRCVASVGLLANVAQHSVFDAARDRIHVVLFIRSHVPESPAFAEAQKVPKPKLIDTLRANWRLALYAVVLMMCFNLFSHGTHDLYPTFLQKQHEFDQTTVSWITIVANLGAIVGDLFFGLISEKIGRVNAITIAALLALPALPLWAYSSTPFMLAIGAFIMQISVQGAWGVIPAHLNELSPGPVRATLPGFVYQAGNFLASYNGPFQGQDRRVLWRQLQFRPRAGRGDRSGCDRDRHPLQPGAARRGHVCRSLRR